MAVNFNDEEIKLLRAMPKDGSFVNLKTLTNTTGYSEIMVVNMLMILHDRGLVPLIIHTGLPESTKQLIKSEDD